MNLVSHVSVKVRNLNFLAELEGSFKIYIPLNIMKEVVSLKRVQLGVSRKLDPS